MSTAFRFTISDLELLPEMEGTRIVDWRAREVRIYRQVANVLQHVATLQGADSLTSALLPGFACPLANVWDAPL